MENWAESFRIAVGVSKVSELIPRLGPVSSPVQSQMLEKFLPALHLVAVVSLLDDLLRGWLERTVGPDEAKKHGDLKRRINAAAAAAPALDRAELHRVRERRNGVAHPRTPLAHEDITWAILYADIASISAAAIALGSLAAPVEATGKYEMEPTHYLGDELGPQGELIRKRYALWAEDAGGPIVRYTSEELVWPVGAGG
jgi:hypothetical protein